MLCVPRSVFRITSGPALPGLRGLRGLPSPPGARHGSVPVNAQVRDSPGVNR